MGKLESSLSLSRPRLTCSQVLELGVGTSLLQLPIQHWLWVTYRGSEIPVWVEDLVLTIGSICFQILGMEYMSPQELGEGILGQCSAMLKTGVDSRKRNNMSVI